MEGLAQIVDDGVARAAAASHAQGDFLRARRFGTGHLVVVVISSFGLLAETARPLVHELTRAFTVVVCEFAAVTASVSDTCSRILKELPKGDVYAVVAHSAGGVWAFELAKTWRGAKVCLLDCFVPPLSQFDTYLMLRFVIRPLQRLKNLPPVDSVPDAYLSGVLVQLLSDLDVPQQCNASSMTGDLLGYFRTPGCTLAVRGRQTFGPGHRTSLWPRGLRRYQMTILACWDHLLKF